MFFNLHCHTEYSALDGMSKISELAQRAKELGQPALAITDHGNMYGVYELYKECKKQNIQPIYGIEFYHKVKGDDERYHLIAYAKSMKGLKTLYKLHALSHKNKEIGKFGREYPIITFNDLIKYHDDIIITTACIGGYIPKLILNKEYTLIDSTIQMLKNLFQDDLYFEIQSNTLKEQRIVNEELIKLGQLYGIKCIIGCDSHYTHKEDASIHEMLLCMQTRNKMSNKNRFKFASNDYWFKSEEEVLEDLKYIDLKIINEMFNNMNELADKCRFEYTMPAKKDCLPKFSDDEKLMLRQHCNTGYAKKLKNKDINHKQYIERIKYELEIIESAGYSGYFLIVQDYINWAKNNNIIVGGGRGSVCGSLVAYITNITSIDPIKHGLYFERFLNPERLSSPDVDIDFNDRDKVVQYLKERWGKSKTASIIAFGRLTAKAVIRKVLSIHDFTQAQINEITKSLPKKNNLTLKDCEESEVFQKYKSMYPDVFYAMYRLEDTIDHFSTHAAGILITPHDIYEYMPTGYDLENDIIISGFDKYTLEEHGLYKFDILKLETLNVINDTLKTIEKFENISIDLDEIDYEDEAIYNDLCEGNVFGVFQLENQKELTMKLQPRNFEDLTLLNTLIRPGVGDIDEYLARKNGKEYKKYEQENSYMDISLGTIAYQEQIMLRVHTLANWSLGQGDKLRKIKNISQNEELRNKFINDCILNKEEAEEIWNEICNVIEGGYSFNKSHSASYAKIAYQTAWLKHYYPNYFIAALMTSERDKKEKIAERVNQCKKMGIKILPPDINKSDENYNWEGDGIRYSINSIEGVGEAAIAELSSLGFISSINDLYNRGNLKVIDKSVFTALILSGCFDFENPNRYKLMYDYYMLRKEKKMAELYKDREITPKEIMQFEKKYFGLYLTHSPFDKYNFKSLYDFENGAKALIGGEITKIKTVFDKNNRKMAFATLTTEFDNVDLVIFANTFNKVQDMLIEGNFVMCKGKRDNNKLILDEIKVLEE